MSGMKKRRFSSTNAPVAMGERSRPRDLDDIVNLFRRDDFRNQPESIRQVLIEKCDSKNVPVPTFAAWRISCRRNMVSARDDLDLGQARAGLSLSGSSAPLCLTHPQPLVTLRLRVLRQRP